MTVHAWVRVRKRIRVSGRGRDRLMTRDSNRDKVMTTFCVSFSVGARGSVVLLARARFATGLGLVAGISLYSV